jgi:hypothetical protein
METKIARLRAAMAAGDTAGALRIAARFPRLGAERERIQRGWAAVGAPDFYAALGFDPDALVADAADALRERYGIGA